MDQVATAAPKKGYKQVRIVDVNGKKFVTGLFWQTLTQLGRYMSEAKEIGKSKNMDMVAIREGSVMQAGFVSKDSGVTKAMYSLSACLADELGTTLAFRAIQEWNKEVTIYTTLDVDKPETLHNFELLKKALLDAYKLGVEKRDGGPNGVQATEGK